MTNLWGGGGGGCGECEALYRHRLSCYFHKLVPQTTNAGVRVGGWGGGLEGAGTRPTFFQCLSSSSTSCVSLDQYLHFVL